MMKYIPPVTLGMLMFSQVIADSFPIRKGINISHFLSQSTKRGEERAAVFHQSDVHFIKEQGFDHIRLPVDEEHLWDEEGNRDEQAFQLMHQTLDWCSEAGLKVIVDLHSLRSHHFNAGHQGRKNTLFTDPASEEAFADLWRELSAELKKYPVDFLAYEILNEPVAKDSSDWNRVANTVVKAIRESEKERWVVIGANRWQNVEKVKDLELPETDRRIILSFHFYTPMVLTHYQASWVSIGKYDGPVHYPGVVVTEADAKAFSSQPGNEKFNVWDSGISFDKNSLENCLKSAMAFSKASERPLYCGEFGCYKKAPRADHLRWTADLVSLFEKHGIAWTKWDYQGGYGIRNSATDEVDSELIQVLMGDLNPN